MGLYDSVDRGKPKPKRLTGPIALCCALFLLFGGLTYWPVTTSSVFMPLSPI